MTTIENVWNQFKEKQLSVGLKQSNWKLEHLVAEEDHDVVKGRCHSIKVKRVQVPANHFVLTSLYRMNKYGNVSGVSEADPKPMDMDRSIGYARFTAILDGTVKSGEFLGYVMLMPVEERSVE
tara:strand:+ start:1323 stop:1691 length:369 start_codon:yes stop_codon:yes gene_type:complete